MRFVNIFALCHAQSYCFSPQAAGNLIQRELKPLADKAFAEGMTRVVYHTIPHNPPEGGIQGWSYQAGIHIGTSLTWWPMISEFNNYLARSSTLLMEGQFVADVAYYYGNDIPNFAKPKPKHIRPDLGLGYDYDDLNTEVLLQTTEVINGKIKLPHGMMYEVLVLPEDLRMDLQVLKKIEELLKKDATIIGPKPERIYGLAGFPVNEILLNQLTDKIWGKSNRKKKIERPYGKGKIISGKTTREVLLDKGIQPDFQYDPGDQDMKIDYIHRNNGMEDIYFIRNVDSTQVLFDAIFRVKDKIPEIWDQVSGKISKCAIYLEEEGTIQLPIELEPFGSVFVVFTKPSVPQPRHIKAIEMEENQIFPIPAKTSDHAYIRYNVHYAAEQSIVFDANKPGTYNLTFDNDKQTKVAIAKNSKLIALQEPWDVRFPAEWVSSPMQLWDSLASWTEGLDTQVTHFSGIATYRKSFELSEAPQGESTQIWLDLGKVGEVARVYLNGQEVGISLFPSHRFDVSTFVKKGMNHLVIEVANTMHNRLVGDLEKPITERKTRSNVTSGPGLNDRYWSGKPLQSSGLMGPVELEIKTKYLVSESNDINKIIDGISDCNE